MRRARRLATLLLAGVLSVPAFVPYSPAPTHPGTFRQPVTGTAAGYTPPGTPILADQLGGLGRLVVEIAWGADLKQDPTTWQWTDITGDTKVPNDGRINMMVGRFDESIQTSPATCNLLLDNRTEAYSPYDPYSANYPYVRRNTPVRIRFSLDASTAYATWHTLFEGLARGFAPEWDTSGNYAVSHLTVDGYLKRVDRPRKPLRSALYRYVTRLPQTSIYAYWPLEDGSTATVGAPGIAGGYPLIVPANWTPPTPRFASLSTIPGSAPVIDLGNGIDFEGTISGASATAWRVQMIVSFGDKSSVDPADRVFYITDSLGAVEKLHIKPSTGGWDFRYTTPAGIFVNLNADTFANTINPFDGKPHRILVDWTQSGSNIAYSFYVDSTLVGSGSIAGTLGAPVNLTLGGFGATDYPYGVGHILFSDQTLDLQSVMNGHSGETATARLARLCAEEGVSISIYDNTATDTQDLQATTMGAQGIATLGTLLRECETTDDGLLFDGLSGGLIYTTRQYRYSRPAAMTLDSTVGEPADPIDPADDDQRDRNIAQVNRTNGSSATVEQPDGPRGTATILDYDTQVTANYADDTQLAWRAAHEVKKGTVDGFRYPRQQIHFHANPGRLADWLAMSLSQRFDITNLRTVRQQLDASTVDLMLEGYSQTISKFEWTVALNGSPNQPWRVAVIEGAVPSTWRLDAGGSYLVSDVTAGTTSLVVQTVDGYPWSTSAADYPQDLSIGGARVTVTAASAASGVLQTFTVTALLYPLRAGWRVALWRPPTIAL